jgi:hypothetical protein
MWCEVYEVPAAMTHWLGAAIALTALLAGGWAMGWPGVLLALTAIVFLLMLQFSKVLRTLRRMNTAPVGRTGSCVMLHARLHKGMPLLAATELAGSLGQPLDGAYRWTDAAGDSVLLRFDAASRLESFALTRAS